MESKSLKPCPLCNSTENLMVYIEYMPVSKANRGVVECTNKLCPMIIRASSIEDAVEKWNHRPREDFLNEQLAVEIENHKKTTELYITALDDICVLNNQLTVVETMYKKADKYNAETKDDYENAFDKTMDMIYDMKSEIDKIRKNKK